MSNEIVEDKPRFLKATESILAEPENLKKQATQTLDKYRKSHPDISEDEVKLMVSKKIISKYSYYAAFSGGTTALSGIIPGIGTAVAIGGGASADAIACIKFQIEMTMEIATVYEHDILKEEEKNLCFIIAGLGSINYMGKEGSKKVASKAFIRLVKEHLKGTTLQIIKEIFKKLGITFTRKALEKAIPFGIGVIIGFSVNKLITKFVGNRAIDFFTADSK
ncbi:hypothetical protein CP965_12310 [Halarcobacter mediterraneus]|uniref:EcsC family protein n=1 Tax=Halarcobacter mediterraneus TaxID=2023153 RepID=A0A4Q1B0J9_9BACT|nr:EcsC family protein [Halarcobacter mediterraneus]RXK11954.1 hypothetical protein CP965_12310 [Halarcobacter mediterraneus]